jgi:hypothetical protein
MLSRLRILRFAGGHHPKPVHHASESHSEGHSHDASHGHDNSHAGHTSHKVIPEGSWHRHDDDEDPYYYYNKYGPFHSYTSGYMDPPHHEGGIPEDDPYENRIQGYLDIVDIKDTRKNVKRSIMEIWMGLTVLATFLGIAAHKSSFDDDFLDKRLGDALFTAQEIEIFIEEAKKRIN